MKTVAIIQARMASTRLPDKVMKKLLVRAACRWHRTVLSHLIN